MIKEMKLLAVLMPVAVVLGTSLAILAYQNLDKTTASMAVIGSGAAVVLGIIAYEYTVRRRMSRRIRELGRR